MQSAHALAFKLWRPRAFILSDFRLPWQCTHPSESRYQIKNNEASSPNLIKSPCVITLLSPTLVTRTIHEYQPLFDWILVYFTGKMAEVSAVKIPPYNFCDPQLWFSTCEQTFAFGVPKAITDTCTKFNYIVSNLPPEATAIVRDFIVTPDETDPYGAIKAQLIHFTQRSEGAYVGTFSSVATDLSANYLGIHCANNRRESRRSRRQNPRNEHSQRFTFDKRHRFIQRKSYPPRD
ncbi:transposon Tf2-9 polyprotein [Trichonephila clavipes]|nr:transposon Tf2-9 polyprotein [Trichonephila clavipes]